MRKTLSFAVLISLLVACNNKKEEDKKSTDTETTTPTTNEPANTETTGIKADVQFADPEVQKVADGYAAFIETYKGGTMLDRNQTAMYLKEYKAWISSVGEIARKLASDPAEAKKWSDWAQRMGDKYKVKANK